MRPSRTLVALLLLLLLAGALNAMVGVQRNSITPRPQEMRDGGNDGGGTTEGDPWQDDDKGGPNGAPITKRLIIIGTPTNPFTFLNTWYVRLSSPIRIQTTTTVKAPAYDRSKSTTK